MPSGNPAMKVRRVLYEWRRMFCWLLYLSKASIFQTLLYCLSHFSTASRLPVSAPSPPRLSHLSVQITLSSLFCQNWQIISHPNPLNWQRHFLHCGCIFPLSRAACLSIAQSLPFASVIPLLLAAVLFEHPRLSHECFQCAPSYCSQAQLSAHSAGRFLCNFLLPFPPNLISLSLVSIIWTV